MLWFKKKHWDWINVTAKFRAFFPFFLLFFFLFSHEPAPSSTAEIAGCSSYFLLCWILDCLQLKAWPLRTDWPFCTDWPLCTHWPFMLTSLSVLVSAWANAFSRASVFTFLIPTCSSWRRKSERCSRTQQVQESTALRKCRGIRCLGVDLLPPPKSILDCHKRHVPWLFCFVHVGDCG